MARQTSAPGLGAATHFLRPNGCFKLTSAVQAAGLSV